MISVDEARRRVISLVGQLPLREVDLDAAHGLVLARDVIAHRDLPGFDNSAMDGFAVRAADTVGASPGAPVSLELAGEVAAGGDARIAVAPGSAVRVMTGAGIPDGADAVVEVEQAAVSGGVVRINLQVDPGRSVRAAGGDIRSGQLALDAGTNLGPAQLALLAALGEVRPECVSRPRVAVIATGDELVDPSVEPGPGQVADIVGVAMRAAVLGAGADAVTIRRAADTEGDVRRAFSDAAAAGADLVISVGGVSMGAYDHVRKVIEADGELDFWRVAMRPGKPLAVGRVAGLPVLGLPGNPVSALVGFEVYALPAILAMSGRQGWGRPRVTATLSAELSAAPGMRTFLRARATRQGAGWQVAPLVGQGSHQLRTLAAANALVDTGAATGTLEVGATADVILLDQAPGPGWG